MNANALTTPTRVKIVTGSMNSSIAPAAAGPMTYPAFRAEENQPMRSARLTRDISATYAMVTGPYIAVARPWTTRTAKSCSGVDTNL